MGSALDGLGALARIQTNKNHHNSPFALSYLPLFLDDHLAHKLLGVTSMRST